MSPVARRSIDEILATQNQRSQFHRRLGGAIERGLQIANDEAPASGRSPGNIFALGPGLDYGASRRNFSQLTQFFSAQKIVRPAAVAGTAGLLLNLGLGLLLVLGVALTARGAR